MDTHAETQKQGAEQRKFIRTSILLKVEYLNRSDWLADYIVNLGQGGMFIRTELPFQLGQEIECAISFPGILQPIEVHAAVRWRQFHDPSRPENPPGVGVEFLWSDLDEKMRLQQFVAHLEERTIAQLPETFRVLLIDNNPFTRELFHYAVRCFHQTYSPSKSVLEVFDADNSEQAMQHLRQRTIDLVICEPFIPGFSGPELIAQLRRNSTPATPILVVSSGSAKTKALCLQSGADFYLEKPVLRSQLVNTLTLLLTHREPPTAGAYFDENMIVS